MLVEFHRSLQRDGDGMRQNLLVAGIHPSINPSASLGQPAGCPTGKHNACLLEQPADRRSEGLKTLTGEDQKTVETAGVANNSCR